MTETQVAPVVPIAFTEQGQSIAFVAGEASGDVHAAAVLRELFAISPGLRAFGYGGPACRAAGAEILLDLTEHAVTGLIEVLAHLRELMRIRDRFVDTVMERKPDAVMFTDFPDFNLSIATRLRKRGYTGKLIYYISPQVWAWRPKRAVGSSRVDLQACKLEYSIVSPK